MSDKTEAAFSIEFDEEGGTVPGVTQLLNPKAIMEKAARDKAKGMPSTPPPILAKPSMSLEPTKTHAVLPDFEGTSPATMPGVNELLKPIEFKAKPLKKITSLEKTAFHEVPSF
ncbi:MAG: hypothetical protein H7333_04265, partial [Bdellovibrionales bacterium]|nr:hypothetical protein [Oligoflexia bacterium]